MNQPSEEEELEQRRARRLQRDLGLSPEGAEVAMRLRQQILGLQSQVHELEIALQVYVTRREGRLAEHRTEFVEGVWRDVVDEKESE